MSSEKYQTSGDFMLFYILLARIFITSIFQIVCIYLISNWLIFYNTDIKINAIQSIGIFFIFFFAKNFTCEISYK